MTDSPDTPTAPDELVQAVHDATRKEGRIRVGRAEALTTPSVFYAVYVLDAVPDGWAKIDGEWVQIPGVSYDSPIDIEIEP